MIYTPTMPRELSQRVARPIPRQVSQEVAQPISRQMPRKVCQAEFLIVCCGNELQGDAAVGPVVAMAISSWKLASVRAVAVEELTPALILELSKTNYVIFVEPCATGDRTVQLCPIVAKPLQSEDIHIEGIQCSANTLLSLTQQIYDRCPQSWRIKVPTEDSGFARRLSSTAQAGVSQVLKTITQFLRTYQSPHG